LYDWSRHSVSPDAAVTTRGTSSASFVEVIAEVIVKSTGLPAVVKISRAPSPATNVTANGATAFAAGYGTCMARSAAPDGWPIPARPNVQPAPIGLVTAVSPEL
jgi:hypothetical protein